MDQSKAPLYESMVLHREQTTTSFHVPGHKSRWLNPNPHLNQDRHVFSGAFPREILSIDFTELPGLDDLHQPQGAIQEAQELAAACFGADETYFLINGSTVGNLALITALCAREDILIVQRNVHKSIIHGLMLGGVKAVFLPPRWDVQSGLPTGVTITDVEYALQKYPEAKGVMLSNPNYYGMGIDLAPIIALSHAYGKPVLIDEAHGAHYGFHPDVPASALSCGADAVVQSTHKMLTAMTMGAMLHVQGSLLNREAIRQRLSILQSSSPSYPIMASLDLSRREIHKHGAERLSQGLEAIHYLQLQLQTNKTCSSFLLLPYRPTSSAYETQDPFKITVRDTTGTLNGFELKRELERHGCYGEMADQHHVLLVYSLASQKSDSDHLIQAFSRISGEYGLIHKPHTAEISLTGLFPQHTGVSLPIEFNMEPLNLYKGAKSMNVRTIPVQDAIHTFSAEMVIPYPPGIPVLFPGELITQHTADYLQRLSSSGASFHGTQDACLKTIRIYHNITI
ncbi:MAG TPA: aminotransferase class I/II-fold pyridoxal phosphate-dependent enzyme [Bacilli bacterium]